MTEYPESVLRIAKAAVLKYKEDVQEAVKEANKNVRRLKNFDELVDLLVSKAMQDLVYDVRHTTNVQTRRDEGKYGPGAKVGVGSSEAVQRASQSVLDSYFIGATVLGSLLGKQLQEIEDSERMIANGHNFNAELCSRLKPLVPANKTVRECVSKRKIRTIWAASKV